MDGARLSCCIAVACLACGARTPLSPVPPGDSDSGASSDASPVAVTLSIPLGTYSGCTSATVTTRPNFVGSTGRDGSITLSREGDGVTAALAFPSYASGSVAFVPTGGDSAALRASQSFDVQTANAGFRVVTVTATSGALSIVGETLFLSTHGSAGSDDVRTFFHCRVPAGLPPTSIVTSAPPPGRLTDGVYRSCTMASSTDGPVRAGVTGGLGSLTVSRSAGALHLTWADSLAPGWACGGLDFGDAPVTAALTPGQECVIQRPCGPPPTLGPSPFPSAATLTNMRGSMRVNGDALFVDVLGDASAQACGTHDLSILCTNP